MISKIPPVKLPIAEGALLDNKKLSPSDQLLKNWYSVPDLVKLKGYCNTFFT